MKKQRLEEYDWDEKTEMAVLKYEGGGQATKHQPLRLKVSSGEQLRIDYYTNLFVWLQLDNRL